MNQKFNIFLQNIFRLSPKTESKAVIMNTYNWNKNLFTNLSGVINKNAALKR